MTSDGLLCLVRYAGGKIGTLVAKFSDQDTRCNLLSDSTVDTLASHDEGALRQIFCKERFQAYKEATQAMEFMSK